MEITYKKGNRVTIKDGSSTKMATVVADGLDSQKRVRVRVDGFPMDMSITTNQSSDVYVIEKMAKGSTVKGKGVSKIYNGDDFEDWIYENHPTFDIDTLHLEEFLEEHYQNMLSHNENFKNLQEWLGEGEGEEEEQEYAKGSTVEGFTNKDLEEIVGDFSIEQYNNF